VTAADFANASAWADFARHAMNQYQSAICSLNTPTSLGEQGAKPHLPRTLSPQVPSAPRILKTGGNPSHTEPGSWAILLAAIGQIRGSGSKIVQPGREGWRVSRLVSPEGAGRSEEDVKISQCGLHAPELTR
jgi:hypothetical protein